MRNSEVINSISKRLWIRKSYVRGIIELYLDTIVRDLKNNSTPQKRATFNITWFWTIKVEYKRYKNPAVLKSKKWLIIEKYTPSMTFSQKFKESINKRDIKK